MGKSGNNKIKNRSTSISGNRFFAWALLAVAVLLTTMVTAAIFAFCFQGDGKSEQLVKAVNGVIIIPIEKVSDGAAHFYRFNNGRKEIVFFVVRGSDGVFHTAFDACERCCFRKREGYIQQGDYMICLGCKEKYAINMIDQVNGIGCKPHHLEHSDDGKNIIIKVSDLKAGAYFF